MSKKIEQLFGKTLTRVEKQGNARIEFEADTGEAWVMHHDQDCCECVEVEDICGELEDLAGAPILQAECSTNQCTNEELYESATWTFYRIATAKGQVVIRWLGTSNGYYSEEVDFDQIK